MKLILTQSIQLKGTAPASGAMADAPSASPQVVAISHGPVRFDCSLPTGEGAGWNARGGRAPRIRLNRSGSIFLFALSALLTQAGLLAQTAAPATAAPAGRGARGATASIQVTGATPEQQSAIAAMEQELAALIQAATTARTALVSASLAEPRNDSDLRAKTAELRTAEQALATARATAFAKLQAMEDPLDAAQIQSLVAAQLGTATTAARGGGGRAGGGGGRGTASPALPQVSLQAKVRQLDAILGSSTALEESKRIAMDANASVESRKLALQTVANRRAPELRSMAEQLLKVPGVNTVAAGALSTIDDPAVGPLLVSAYPQFQAADRPQLVAALIARSTTAKALLDAVSDGKIPRSEVSAFAARQIASFNNPELTQQLTRVWGNLRESDAERKQLAATLKAQLTPQVLAAADRSAGRVHFNNICAACHSVFGNGGNIGPDLTGVGRGNLDYLLANIADPSAEVAKDFAVTVANLKDGRVVNGMVASETDRALALKTTTGVVTLQKADIASQTQSELSMMPDGLAQTLRPEQFRDLIAYLTSPAQVPLPAK